MNKEWSAFFAQSTHSVLHFLFTHPFSPHRTWGPMYITTTFIQRHATMCSPPHPRHFFFYFRCHPFYPQYFHIAAFLRLMQVVRKRQLWLAPPKNSWFITSPVGDSLFANDPSGDFEFCGNVNQWKSLTSRLEISQSRRCACSFRNSSCNLRLDRAPRWWWWALNQYIIQAVHYPLLNAIGIALYRFEL